MEIALENYLPSWFLDYMSPIMLMISGLVAILIVAMYLKNKESGWYKLSVGIGVALGIIIVILAVLKGFNAHTPTLILITIAAFALIIRPIREVHVSVIIGLIAMVIVYLALDGLNGKVVSGIDLSALAAGWPRIILAFIAGAVIYGLLNFAEAVVKLIGKFLNCWPVLLILGLLCIAEATCMLLGYGSILDYIQNIPWKDYLPNVNL